MFRTIFTLLLAPALLLGGGLSLGGEILAIARVTRFCALANR